LPVRLQIQRDGTAQIMLDVPDFEGQLRLMAVAYSRHAIGYGKQKPIVETRSSLTCRCHGSWRLKVRRLA
jgi:uncharacterized protein YfaS (alpha-2-macroglobulin family)